LARAKQGIKNKKLWPHAVVFHKKSRSAAAARAAAAADAAAAAATLALDY
jgi:hypothetical protein